MRRESNSVKSTLRPYIRSQYPDLRDADDEVFVWQTREKDAEDDR